MNKDKARDGLTQRILDLALEMIFLLTGEDHAVVKIREMGNSSQPMSKEYTGTAPPPDSPIRERHNEQKILELTHRILRLLTGEVPIRCEDVTVHLSMEEWEYVERHKELYKDYMMEDHQPVITADNSVFGEFPTLTSVPDFGNITNNGEKYPNEATKTRAESARDAEQESLTREENLVTKPITDYPFNIKEEPASCEEGNLTDLDVYKPVEHTQTEYSGFHIKAESDSGGEGDLADPAIHPPTEHTRTEYPFTDIKREFPTWEEANLTDGNIYKHPKHTQTEYEPARFKANANPLDTHFCESLIRSRKSHQAVSNTELITAKLFYKGNSTISSEMGKVSFSESDLVSHETKCTELFSPADHGDDFIPRSALEHQKTPTEAQPFSCSECGEVFTDRNALKTHQNIHTEKKLFKCNECGKCFTWSSSLARHKKIHKGGKTFKCPECWKCFNWASCLARHKKIHTGEKPFKCAECGKCFTQASYLAEHKMTHTGERPFKCTECGKGFTKASSLTAHKLIHTGEKPFKCTDCGRGFNQASNLAKHKMTHAKDIPFNCTECGKCLTHALSLVRHKMIHTG